VAVITAAGCVSGYGVGLEPLKAGLLSGVRPFSHWPSPLSVDMHAPLVCRVPLDDDPEDTLSRSARLALIAAKQALRGVTDSERAETAVIVGGTSGGLHLTESLILDAPFSGMAAFGANAAREHPVSSISLTLSQRFALQGPRTSVIAACASGLAAMIMAKRWVDAGLCKRALAVGTDALCRLTVSGFASLGSLDSDGMRPFHRERRGLTLGEGAAAFLIRGGSLVSEAYHVTHPDPSGAGAERAMHAALKEAGLRAQDISAVSAHGTATALNDAMEIRALSRIFGERIPVTAPKSQLGHTLGAAGALESVICLLMLRHQVIFPTHALTDIAAECLGVDHVRTEPRHTEVNAIMKNSFAFGGQNSALILQRV
jgi:3-oxoacyl-[acyl-carrier-protein] synthase II